jgi:NAD(P)-dependent dehydrogenase (short-subunit alcohol dehydrogenase family)
MTAFGFKQAGEEAFNAVQPTGRYGYPSDVAGLAIFLSSAAGSHVTGTQILLDGGSRFLRHNITPATKL